MNKSTSRAGLAVWIGVGLGLLAPSCAPMDQSTAGWRVEATGTTTPASTPDTIVSDSGQRSGIGVQITDAERGVSADQAGRDVVIGTPRAVGAAIVIVAVGLVLCMLSYPVLRWIRLGRGRAREIARNGRTP